MRRFVSLPLVTGAVVLAGFSTTAPATASWTQRDPTGGRQVSEPRVWDGRVWWFEGTTSKTVRYVAYSRALSGSALRSTPLDTSALPRPAGRNAQGYPYNSLIATAAIAKDGKPVLQGVWGTDPDLVDPNQPSDGVAPTGVLAAFDAATGSLRDLKQPTVDATGRLPRPLVAGWPAASYARVTNGLPGQPSTGWQLSDPLTGAPFTGRGSRVSGAYVLGFSATDTIDRAPFYEANAWARGSGFLRVASLETNRERYTVRAGTIRRAAGADRGSAITVALQGDGSLGVNVKRRKGHGLYAVAVDRNGHVRRVGAKLVQASEVGTITGAKRGFLRVRSPRASCRVLWLSDTQGRNGRELLASADLKGRDREVPIYWNGRFAVWQTSGAGRQHGSTGIRVDSGLQNLRLRDAVALKRRCAN